MMAGERSRRSDCSAWGKIADDQVEIVIEDGRALVTREQRFSAEIIDFLDEMTWGTKDVLYEHKNTGDRLQRLKDPLLFVLRLDGKLAGTVVIERRRVMLGERQIKGYFLRYLSSEVSFRNRLMIGRYGRQIMNMLVEDAQGEGIFYASVESKNVRSINFLSKVGYDEVASIRTLGYSRFWPRRDNRMRQLTEEEKPKFAELLRAHYRQHTLVQFEHLFEGGNYFALYEQGQPVAGIQAHRSTWIVKSIPGRWGSKCLKWLPYIPMVRSIFNPDNFEFLALEAPMCRQGSEGELLALIESVMAHFRVRACFLWLDERDPLLARLEQEGQYGLMSKFVDGAGVKILAIKQRLAEPSIAHIQQHPVYVSGFDFI